MNKIVFLKLDGKLKQGFHVVLEIWQKNDPTINPTISKIASCLQK